MRKTKSPRRVKQALSVLTALSVFTFGLLAATVAQPRSAGAVDFLYVPSSFTGLPTQSVDYSDFSGATVDGSGNLWTVDNSKAHAVSYRNDNGTWVVSRSFSIADIGGVSISDPESITWLSGTRFAVIDEATNALHYLNFGSRTPVRERLVPLGEKIPIPTRNRGIEGLTYDREASSSSLDVFYVGVEAPATLYRVEVGRGFTIKAMPLPIPEIAGLEKVPGTNKLYVISEADDTIYRTTTGGTNTVKIGSASQFAQPEGIALDPNGLLYVLGEAGTYTREFGSFRLANPDEKLVPVIESTATTARYELETRVNDVQERDRTISNSTRTLTLNAATKIGLRIPGVCVDETETIVEAHLKLVASETASERTVATVRADANPTPAEFSQALLTGRRVTSTRQRWVMPSVFSGEQITSPDLAAVISEVTNAEAWPGCGDIVLILQGSGNRSYRAFDSGAPFAAMLEVKTIVVPKSDAHIPDPAPIRSSATAMLQASELAAGSGLLAAPETADQPDEPQPVSAAPDANLGPNDHATDIAVPELPGSTGIESNTVESSIAESNTVESNIAESNTVESTIAESNIVEASIVAGTFDRERMGPRKYTTSRDLDLSTGIEVTLGYTVCVPTEATVDHATIGFVAAGDTDQPTETTIRAGVNDTWSTASVGWPIGSWARGDHDDTPDLAPIVNEAIRAEGWTGCGQIDFQFSSKGRRQAFSFDGSPDDAPHLVISYS